MKIKVEELDEGFLVTKEIEFEPGCKQYAAKKFQDVLEYLNNWLPYSFTLTVEVDES